MKGYLGESREIPRKYRRMSEGCPQWFIVTPLPVDDTFAQNSRIRGHRVTIFRLRDQKGIMTL